jgi:Fic family protein
MFNPVFSYTNKIVKNLTAIAESRAIILNSPLVPKWEISLRKDAIIRSAHSSTAIEGNRLSQEEVSMLAEGRDIMVRRKDRQEVLNYLEALNKIPDFSGKVPFKSEDLLKIHKIVTNNTLEDSNDEGKFRNRQVFVGSRLTGAIVFEPPPTILVHVLINDFLEWFNSSEINDVGPVIQSGITHYEIVRIHPFIDGNGRTARILAILVLFKRGFDSKRFFALDDYYDHNRREYYEALGSVNQQTLDTTEWLEYFTDGVLISMKAVKDKVIGLNKGIKILKEKGQIALSERQMQVVEMLIQKGKITNRDIRSMFDISNRAALNEIEKLLKAKVIKKTGEGRSINYILV